MAGVTTVALLERKPAISRSLFSRYWRDVHGVMAARINGFESYIQYHVTPVAGTASAPEPFEGIAVCRFGTAADRTGLIDSAITPHIHRDERNVFRRALLYNLDEGASVARGAQEAPVQAFVVLPQGTDCAALIDIIGGFAPDRLHVHDLASGDPSGWNDTDAADGGTGRLFAALVEIGWTRGDRIDAVLAALGSSEVAAYRVDEAFAMVSDGRPTAIGLRGLDAVRTIEEAGAINQLEDDVVRAIYGAAARI